MSRRRVPQSEDRWSPGVGRVASALAGRSLPALRASLNRTPGVIDGGSDVLAAIFGDAGRHTRSAVGMAELPFDISVEIEMIAQLRPE